MRISEVSGLRVDDVDLDAGPHPRRPSDLPGPRRPGDQGDQGPAPSPVPIIEPLRPTLERLTPWTAIRQPGCSSGPRGGVITTATLRDATGWDELVRRHRLAGLVRHGLRHTALTWMADAGVELHILQRVAGHQDPAVTSRYLHPDYAGDARRREPPSRHGGPSLVPSARTLADVRLARAGMKTGPDLREQVRPLRSG